MVYPLGQRPMVGGDDRSPDGKGFLDHQAGRFVPQRGYHQGIGAGHHLPNRWAIQATGEANARMACLAVQAAL